MATQLHEKKIHLDLVDQPRVQDLRKNQQWQDQLPRHSTSINKSDTLQIARNQPVGLGVSPASPQNSGFAID